MRPCLIWLVPMASGVPLRRLRRQVNASIDQITVQLDSRREPLTKAVASNESVIIDLHDQRPVQTNIVRIRGLAVCPHHCDDLPGEQSLRITLLAVEKEHIAMTLLLCQQRLLEIVPVVAHHESRANIACATINFKPQLPDGLALFYWSCTCCEYCHKHLRSLRLLPCLRKPVREKSGHSVNVRLLGDDSRTIRRFGSVCRQCR